MNKPLQPIEIMAIGHKCPVPSLKLRRAYEAHPDHGFILWADDPMAQIDIPHLCRSLGLHCHDPINQDGVFEFRIEPKDGLAI